MGYMMTLQTKLEQILCSRGYSDTLAGLSAALIIIAHCADLGGQVTLTQKFSNIFE